MDAPATATERPAPPPPKPARLGLGLRIFLLVSLLIFLAVAASVAFTWYLADRIARQEIAESLEADVAIRETADLDRYDRFQAYASLFIADANVQAYVAESVAQDQTASLLDLLLERQEDLGFDFAILLDPAGAVLARTDRLADAGVDLSSRPLVAAALEGYQAAGVWSEGGRLYHAVAIPVAQGFDLLGFFVAAFRIDDRAAREAQRITGSHIVLMGLAEDSFRVVGSTLETAPTSLLSAAFGARPAIFVTVANGSEMFPVEVTLSGKPWIAHVAPLRDAAGGAVGAAVSLASLEEELAPYRRIELALILSGLGALLVAFGLTYAMAGRILRPIRRLVAAADAAREGDYSQRIEVERVDEIGKLGLALDHLLSDLRDKRDMELYVAELSRNLPAAGAGETEAAPAEISEMSLLGIEFRRHGAANTAPGGSAERALAELETDFRRAAEEVGKRGGRILGRSGHRLLAGFDRAEHTRSALGAASHLLLAAAGSPHPPLLAVASGHAAVRFQSPEDGQARAVGRPLQVLESLLREGSSGEILVSDGVFGEVGPSLSASGIGLTERRGLVTPIRFYSLDAASARQLASQQAASGDLSPLLTPLSPGTVIAGRFEVLSRLGSGGMGVVYKARDRELDDVVALKILRLGRFEGPEKTAALKQELKLARQITHPNVLRVFDLGQIDGVPFVSMEYVRGLTMRDLLDHATEVPYSAALRISRQVCQGLAAVHEAGIIHRDIKPENVLLDPSGNVRLMDFGIAERLGGRAPAAEGMVRGTPRYLAPEQILGKEFDTRADIFACGVLFYELFTGRLPFPDSRNPAAVIQATLDVNPPPPHEHRAGIPPALDEILLRCLRKDPRGRYRDARELLVAFEGLTP